MSGVMNTTSLAGLLEYEALCLLAWTVCTRH
jgi:hypothetical protein